MKQINNFVTWILKAKEVMSNQGANYTLIEKMRERGMITLKDKLKKIQDFDETSASKFLVDHRRLIGELLQIINQPEAKLKSDSFDLEYIEELIAEAQKVKLPSDENGLVEELQRIIERGKSWVGGYQKLKVTERKKKGGKGSRAKKGQAKREAQEKASKAEPEPALSESNMEVEQEKQQLKVEEVDVDAVQSEKGKSEVKTEIKSEAPGSEFGVAGVKPEITIIDDEIPEEKKEEVQSEAPVKQEVVEKVRPKFSRESDNYFYFFKLPLLVATFYDGLEARASVEDLEALKRYLNDIYVSGVGNMVVMGF